MGLNMNANLNIGYNTKNEVLGISSILPVLTLRDSVFFPGSIGLLLVGRKKTIALIKDIVKREGFFGVLTQKSCLKDHPVFEDLYQVGTVARILKVKQNNDFEFTLVIEGLYRFSVQKFIQHHSFVMANILLLEDFKAFDIRVNLLSMKIKSLGQEIIRILPEMPVMAKKFLDSIVFSKNLSNVIISNIEASVKEKQLILETSNLADRLSKILELLHRYLEALKISNTLKNKIKDKGSKIQREYYLREQFRVIKEKLGIKSFVSDLSRLKKEIRILKFPNEIRGLIEREVGRISNMQSNQVEYAVIKTYIDWLIKLPWYKETKDNLNLRNVKKRLNEDHFGLYRVKRRIIEYLAVRKLKRSGNGPILCLIGPPGVGKTSLGKSIAEALNKKFYRVSLGGVRDEAEIRGHRRTYIGAMPGKIIQGIKKVGCKNPLFLLDEIDKLGNDFRGDPAAALLEVLDPEQNSVFKDHYLDINFDLSNIFFLATANEEGTISAPLRDRMEIIKVSGYTLDEKIEIIKRYVIPNQIIKHGLSGNNIIFEESGIYKIAINYTKEVGIRGVEKCIASICRSIAVEVAQSRVSFIVKKMITSKNIESILGPERFFDYAYNEKIIPGVAVGLAWTSLGGEVLLIEVSQMPGKGLIILTGQLGSIMKESAHAALSWVRAHQQKLNIPLRPDFFKKMDLHIHFPAGATPKDGPSAGIAIVTAIKAKRWRRCRACNSFFNKTKS